MLMQKQPNSWSCLPTAFAIALDINVSEILDWILTHFYNDGSQLIREGNHPYRGFHPQELIHYCSNHGIRVTDFEFHPALWDGTTVTILPKSVFQNKIYDIMFSNEKGVLTGNIKGNSHAVAYENQKIYDPNGTIYDWQMQDWEHHNFFHIHK